MQQCAACVLLIGGVVSCRVSPALLCMRGRKAVHYLAEARLIHGAQALHRRCSEYMLRIALLQTCSASMLLAIVAAS